MASIDATKQKIMACLWFDSNAEEAIDFYTSAFENSRIRGVTRYGEAGSSASGRPAGTVMTIAFELEGQEFLAINGGPKFAFSPAISFIVNCETQEEVNGLWEKFSEGGETQQCGWVTDRYGVSWQIVPRALGEMMQDKDPAKSHRVMTALLRMKKIDMGVLQEAYEGGKI